MTENMTENMNKSMTINFIYDDDNYTYVLWKEDPNDTYEVEEHFDAIEDFCFAMSIKLVERVR